MRKCENWLHLIFVIEKGGELISDVQHLGNDGFF